MQELPPRNAPHDLGDPRPTSPTRTPPGSRRRGIPLHTRIFLALLAGAAAGIAVNSLYGPGNETVEWVVSNITEPIGTLFLRLLSMIVIPLVVSSLIVGVAGIGDIRTLGRIGLKSFAYTLAFSAISVAIGVTLTNTIQPGRALSPQVRDELEMRGRKRASEEVKKAGQAKSAVAESPLMQAVKTLVPANPVAAAAGETPNMMQLMVYALLVGIAVTLLPRATTSGPAGGPPGTLRGQRPPRRPLDAPRPRRGRLPPVQQHRALRAGPAPIAALVRGHGVARPGTPDVRGLPALGPAAVGHLAVRVLPPDRDGRS